MGQLWPLITFARTAKVDCEGEATVNNIALWDTVKGNNHPSDVGNAGKDGGRVHQDNQEDVKKDLFHGQFANVSTPVRMNPCPRPPTPYYMDRGGRHLDWERWPLERQVLGKSCSHWFALAGNLLGRVYCLQVANMVMYLLNANIPNIR